MMNFKHMLRVWKPFILCCKPRTFNRNSCHTGKWTFETHSCGSLTREHVGQKVILTGWIQNMRMGHQFILLRDKTGTVQLMINGDWIKSFEKATLESSICVEGKVIERPQGQGNRNMNTGDIEILVENVHSFNPSVTSLPFHIDKNEANETLRMKHRYLDLRNPRMQRNLKTRSDLVHKMRNFLHENHFTEVETPTLFRRTPGGAREFVVPTHQADHFYTLVQSPQQFKQLLMVGGLEKYYQIARCYRDEGARPDRQPEFTQLDIELSYTNAEKIQSLIEELLRISWPGENIIPKEPFPRLTYAECMSKYGSDKPDLRYSNQIQDVAFHEEKFIKAIAFSQEHFSNQMSRSAAKSMEKELRALYPSVITSFFEIESNTTNGDKIKTNAKKFLPKTCNLNVSEKKQGDIGFFAIGDKESDVQKALGKLRTLVIQRYSFIDENHLEFLWVVDFPMFLSREDGQEGLEAAHHPFTRPKEKDIHLMKSNPEQVLAQHYDLVLNGHEIGGGSMRIHEPELQKYILENILNEDTSELKHMLEALSFGCPPHGGIALGLDRLIGIICQTNSIRDVIAFPKSTAGKDLMSEAPAKISCTDKEYYHLK